MDDGFACVGLGVGLGVVLACPPVVVAALEEDNATEYLAAPDSRYRPQ